MQRADGGLYGYFTADPVRDKVSYACCGFGMAESRDGITWTALPPPQGDISGEFGGIQKLGQRYFILISEGRVAVGDRPTGPFYAQQKNPNVFGQGCDIYFPRFFHNAPGGPLVNHFYNNGPVFARAVEGRRGRRGRHPATEVVEPITTNSRPNASKQRWPPPATAMRRPFGCSTSASRRTRCM